MRATKIFKNNKYYLKREINAVNSSKNIEIYLVQRTAKAGHKISGQTGVAMFTSATYVWTFIWR